MAIRTMKLCYPSGIAFEAKGEFHGIVGRESPMCIELADAVDINGQTLDAGSVLAADPRSICVDVSTDEVLSNPREHLQDLSAEMNSWLAEHPEWPSVLELGVPTRKYTPPPWVWSDSNGREAYALRSKSGKPS
jgi:hypothetical protein